MMFILSLIAFIAVLGFTLFLTNASLFYMFDPLSILTLLLTLLPILMASGMERDLLRALQLAVRKSMFLSLRELKRCEEAVSLTIRLLLYAGILIFLIQGNSILYTVDDPSIHDYSRILLLNFTVAILSLIYPLFLCCLLLPIRSKIRCRMIDMESPCRNIIPEDHQA